MEPRKHKDENSHSGKAWILVLVLILIAGVLYLMYRRFWDPQNPDSSLNTLIQLYSCLAAVIAALAAGIGTGLTWLIHVEDRQSEVFSYWYKAIVLDRYLSEIDRFFTDTGELLEKLQELNNSRKTLCGEEYDKKLKEEIAAPFTGKYTNFRKRITFDLDTFDNGLSKRVSQYFADVQDIFFEGTNEVSLNFDRIEGQIKEKKRQILKELMEFDKMANRGSRIRNWFYQK